MTTNRFFSSTKQILVSTVIGAATAYTLIYYYFNEGNYSATDRFFLFAIPFISSAVCVYYLIPFWERVFNQVPVTTKAMLVFFALFSAFTVTLPVFSALTLFSASVFISLSAIFLAGGSPAAAALQKAIEAKNLPRLLAGWAFSTVFVFIITGFLDTFYSNIIEISCIALAVHTIVGTPMYFLVHRLGNFAKKNRLDFIFMLGLFLAIFIFIQRLFQYGAEAPEFFIPEYFSMKTRLLSLVGATSVFFIPWQAWIISKFESFGFREKFKRTKLYTFIDENLTGLTIALAFFALYLVITTALNHPLFDVDDIFFDADGMNWKLRLTTDNWQDYYWRSVHPFVLLLLKPPVDFIAMFLRGDKLFSSYIVVALGGALCVFLAWKFINRVTGNLVYASLISSILGFSASHLIFGALIESYIFLAASLLLFFLFLLEDKPLSTLILASLPVVGITHSNFAQNVLALFTTKPNLKLMLRYVTVILILLVQLSLLNNLFFPDAHPFFFIPSALLAEERNFFPLNALRGQALIRAFLFSNVVAPTPILHTGEIPFTQFRFFKPEINALSLYDTPLQTSTAWFWLGLILLGTSVFIIKFREYKTNRLSLALLGTMALNVGLHLRYGKELFLYSANWTYALILLLGLALQGFSKHRWLQITLLIFIYFLMINNGWLFDTIFYVLSPE